MPPKCYKGNKTWCDFKLLCLGSHGLKNKKSSRESPETIEKKKVEKLFFSVPVYLFHFFSPYPFIPTGGGRFVYQPHMQFYCLKIKSIYFNRYFEFTICIYLINWFINYIVCCYAKYSDIHLNEHINSSIRYTVYIIRHREVKVVKW